ncbi:MAG: FAD-linked oxidase C-terminal domain-containing protein [Planctomycetota bacterium]|nr:FAD-linked oxidase C-terminal domain-containing protein [Planctomycetota bacterium]
MRSALKLSEVLRAITEIGRETGIRTLAYGHVGDGNLHVNFLLEKNDDENLARAHEAAGMLFRKTVQLGGTLSGEHGIGLTKQPFLSLEVKAPEMEIMRSVKRIFDPSNLLNPGKIFPPEDSANVREKGQ